MKVYSILMICIFSMAELCMSDKFMDGYTQVDVIKMLGNPIREIETGDGVLLFYGSVFLEVVGDSVIFINVSDENTLEMRRLADAKRGIYWGKISLLVEKKTDDSRHMTDDEIEEWSAIKKRQLDMVVETRVRRFLLTQTFKSVLARIPVIQEASEVSDGDNRVNLHNLAANSEASVISLKDSHGVPLRAVGEETEYNDRYVSFEESLFGEDFFY